MFLMNCKFFLSAGFRSHKTHPNTLRPQTIIGLRFGAGKWSQNGNANLQLWPDHRSSTDRRRIFIIDEQNHPRFDNRRH